MSLKLDLGDVVIDKMFSVKAVIVAKADENGKPEILAGYENNSEVWRVFPMIANDEGRVAIVIEDINSGWDLGSGYYTWTDDFDLVEVV